MNTVYPQNNTKLLLYPLTTCSYAGKSTYLANLKSKSRYGGKRRAQLSRRKNLKQLRQLHLCEYNSITTTVDKYITYCVLLSSNNVIIDVTTEMAAVHGGLSHA